MSGMTSLSTHCATGVRKRQVHEIVGKWGTVGAAVAMESGTLI